MDQPATHNRAKRGDNISLAVTGLKDGTYASRKEAATALGVARSTLGRRLRGGLSCKEAMARRRNLTPHEERVLAEWITRRRAAGHNIAYCDMIAKALELRKRRLGQSATAVGKSWLSEFLKRHRLARSKSYPTFRAFCPEKGVEDLPAFEQEESPVPDDIKSENACEAAETGLSFISFN